MATPDVRVRLSPEGLQDVLAAFAKIRGEGEKAGAANAGSFNNFNTQLRTTKQLLAGVGIGFSAMQIVQGVRESIDIVRQWETAWAEVRTILAATDEQANVLEGRVRGLTNIIPQNESLLARGYYETLSAGITEAGSALYFLERAARAAVGGRTETLVAVDIGTTIINAYKKPLTEVDAIFDQLFATVREGKIVFPELAELLGRAIPIFATARIPLEELLAAVATLTIGGLEPDIAITSLRDMMVKLVKPTDEAKKLAKDLGIEFSTEAVAAKGLVAWLKELAEKTNGNAEAIATLFPEVRGLTGVLALSGNQWDQYGRILDAVKNKSGGESLQAFDKMSATLESQEQLLRNRLVNQWLNLGKAISGGSKAALAAIGSMIPESFEEQMQAIGRGRRRIEEIDGAGQELAGTYERLVRESDGTAESQLKVNEAMQRLAERFPEIITRMDEYGNVVEVDTGRLRDLRLELNKTLDAAARKSFQETAESSADIERNLRKAVDVANTLAQALDLKVAKGKTPFQDLLGLDQATFLQEQGVATFFTQSDLFGTGTRSFTPEQYQEILDAAHLLILQLQEDLTGSRQKMAQTIVEAGLAPALLEFDNLALAVEENKKPISELDEAVKNLSDRFIVLFGTVDPKEIRRRMRDVAPALRSIMPSSTAGGEGGPGSTGTGGGTGGGGDDEAAKAAVRLAAAARQREIQLVRAQAQRREAEERAAYQSGLIDVQQYYSRRQAIIEDAAAQETRILESGRAAAGADKTDDLVDQVKQRSEERLAQMGEERRREVESLLNDQLALEQRLFEAQGMRHAAAMIAIDQEIAKADLLYRQAGKSEQERQRMLAELRGTLTANADFEELDVSARRDLEDLAVRRDQINERAQAGLMSQYEADRRILDLESQRLIQLQQTAATLLDGARATGDPERIAQAEAYARAVQSIQTNIEATQETWNRFDAVLRDSTQGALTDFLNTGIEGFKSWREAAGNMVAAVLADLRRLAAQMLAMRILSWIPGVAPAAAASTATSSSFIGPPVPGKRDGGLLGGVGTGTSDSNLAYFSRHEYLMPERRVLEPGVLSHLERIRRHGSLALRPFTLAPTSIPRFAEGGLISSLSTAVDSDRAGHDDRLTVALEDGLVARELVSTRGVNAQIQNASNHRRAFRRALGL